MNASAEKRVKSQQNAVELLFENYRDALQSTAALKQDAAYQTLRKRLSDATVIFSLTDLQKQIYHNDTGTSMIPQALKRNLLNIKCRFVVRPGKLEDVQKFIEFARSEKVKFTIRGAGTWPFGGAVPLKTKLCWIYPTSIFMRSTRKGGSRLAQASFLQICAATCATTALRCASKLPIPTAARFVVGSSPAGWASAL
ncbi:MAG: hypothetical protein R3C26_02545 [Calditrichia bacterium]